MNKYLDASYYHQKHPAEKDKIKTVLLTRILKLSSANTPATYHSWAEILKNRKQYPKALRVLQKVITIDSNHLNALLSYGEVLLKLEKYNQILTFSKIALQKYPNLLTFHENLLMALDKLDRSEQFELIYKKISDGLSSDGRRGDLYDGAASALRRKLKCQQALLCLKKAAEFCPSSGLRRVRYGKVLLKEGLLEEAMIEFEAARGNGWNLLNIETIIAYGKYYTMKVEEAIEEMTAALEKINNMWVDVGYAYVELGVMLYHLYEDEERITPYKQEIRQALFNNVGLEPAYEELKLTQLKLEGQLDEESRNFNLKKLKAWKFIINWIDQWEMD